MVSRDREHRDNDFAAIFVYAWRAQREAVDSAYQELIHGDAQAC